LNVAHLARPLPLSYEVDYSDPATVIWIDDAFSLAVPGDWLDYYDAEDQLELFPEQYAFYCDHGEGDCSPFRVGIASYEDSVDQVAAARKLTGKRLHKQNGSVAIYAYDKEIIQSGEAVSYLFFFDGETLVLRYGTMHVNVAKPEGFGAHLTEFVGVVDSLNFQVEEPAFR